MVATLGMCRGDILNLGTLFGEAEAEERGVKWSLLLKCEEEIFESWHCESRSRSRRTRWMRVEYMNGCMTLLSVDI
jgi:hypothetical protein